MGVAESTHRTTTTTTTTRAGRSSSVSSTASEPSTPRRRVRHSSKQKNHNIRVRPPIEPAAARAERLGTKHHTNTPVLASERASETVLPVRAVTTSGGARMCSGTDSTSDTRSQADAFYWRQVGATLAPINSAEEYTRRFNTTPASFHASADAFAGFAGSNGYITAADWLAFTPKSAAAQQWARHIWRTFVPADSHMTLAEWLVFDGVRKHGSLEQRTAASFVLFDLGSAGVLRREDVAAMMRLASDVAGAGLSESLIQHALEQVMNEADKQHTGILQLEEVIKAARAKPDIAQIFNAV